MAGQGNACRFNDSVSPLIIAIITAAGKGRAAGGGATTGCVPVLIHNLSGYLLGYSACRLLRMDEKSCRTIALEVGLQNGGLASGIALEMGKVVSVGLAPAVFGPMMNITGSSLATWWRNNSTEEKEADQSRKNAITFCRHDCN